MLASILACRVFWWILKRIRKRKQTIKMLRLLVSFLFLRFWMVLINSSALLAMTSSILALMHPWNASSFASWSGSDKKVLVFLYNEKVAVFNLCNYSISLRKICAIRYAAVFSFKLCSDFFLILKAKKRRSFWYSRQERNALWVKPSSRSWISIEQSIHVKVVKVKKRDTKSGRTHVLVLTVVW